MKKRKREKGRGKKNDECIYTYAYQQDNSSLIFSTAIFNAFSLGVSGSGSLHFVPFRSIFNGTRPSTRGWKIIVAPRTDIEARRENPTTHSPSSSDAGNFLSRPDRRRLIARNDHGDG